LATLYSGEISQRTIISHPVLSSSELLINLKVSLGSLARLRGTKIRAFLGSLSQPKGKFLVGKRIVGIKKLGRYRAKAGADRGLRNEGEVIYGGALLSSKTDGLIMGAVVQ